MGIGYPYFGEIRVNVGATKKPSWGFDAGVGVRSFGARSELGLGVRFMLVNKDPLTLGAFTDLWWGSKLLDNSGRNGVTWNAGALASLTALTHVTITGRAYLNMWSDRHCPSYDATTMDFAADAKPINACEDYLTRVVQPGLAMADPATMPNEARMEALTGLKGTDMFGRENGARLMLSIVAEVAYSQNWSIWFLLEGAPLNGERALLTDQFAAPMTKKDYGTYARVGATYKF
jgi:hypothetical protein